MLKYIPPLAVGSREWALVDLGDDLKLWLRPDELVNPNRLLQTEDLENAAWTNTTVTVLSGQTDKDGGSAAFKLTPAATGSNLIQSAQGFHVSADDAASLWWKRATGHDGTSKATVRIDDGVGTTDINVVPPATWTRITTLTRTLDGSATKSALAIFPDSDSGTEAILVQWPQLESGTAATTYVANTTTAGGIIASWADQSGNGNDATEATQAEMPLVLADALDGYAGAVFDGVDDLLTLGTAITTTSGLEVWFVLQPSDLSAQVTILNGSSVADRFLWQQDDGGMDVRIDASAIPVSTAGAVVVDTPALIRMKQDGSGNLTCEVNGVDVTSGSPSSTDDVSIEHLASAAGTSQWWNGCMIEGAVVDGVLSANNATELLSYFAAKFPTLGI